MLAYRLDLAVRSLKRNKVLTGLAVGMVVAFTIHRYLMKDYERDRLPWYRHAVGLSEGSRHAGLLL